MTAVVLLISVVTVTHPYRSGPAISSDGVGYHIWTRALLSGDLSFCPIVERWHSADVEDAISHTDRARRICENRYPPGLAVLRLPLMAPFVRWGPGAPLISPGEHAVNTVCGAVVLLLTLLIIVRSMRLLGVSRAISEGVAVLFAFGTSVFHYGTFDASFAHIYGALGSSILLLALVQRIVTGRRRVPALPVALTAFFLILLRNTNALLILAFIGAYLVVAGLRRGVLDSVPALAGAASALCVQVAYNFYASRLVTLSSYGDVGFVWNRPMVRSVLASYDRGLFTYAPLVAVALTVGGLNIATGRATATYGLLLLGFAVLYGYWWSWPLGDGFGHRGFVELMPVGAVIFGYALQRSGGRA